MPGIECQSLNYAISAHFPVLQFPTILNVTDIP
jgi:hypothetical protein